ncbi:MAG: BMP family ABC transporter substrate-binding protein [Deltaproteobacteria bacterium]|nr:BMP family ABC transporter substrate-binding protein [Deltaproteobacteria bacterium]
MSSPIRTCRALAIALPLLCSALLAAGCSFIVDSKIKKAGIGGACASDDDCHASTCDRGICVAKCEVSVDCPVPSTCVKNLCQLPLKVRGVWVGVVSGGEGWTLTHQDGIDGAKANLGYVDFGYKEGLIGPSVTTAIDDFVKEGAQLIIANSFDHRDQIAAGAAKYPDVKFLICSGRANNTNMGAYFGRLEQAWFVAGKVAAQKATTRKRLGFVGSYITPEVVRHANAFLRGARSVVPEMTLEVRWVGFWYDYNQTPTFTYKLASDPNAVEEKLFAEEYAAALLIDGGAEVVAHQMDNQRISRYVEKHTVAPGGLKDVWTIANDNQYGWRNYETKEPLTTALGAVYWNWTSMYTRLLDEIHRQTWKPSEVMDTLIQDHATSTVYFEQNLSPKIGIDDTVVRAYLNEQAQKSYLEVFRGPYETTGQRAALKEGEALSEDEWRSMCWFSDGVVEKADPTKADLTSPDQPAKVPASDYQPADPANTAPTTAPWILLAVPGTPRGVAWNCSENQIKQ